MYKPVALVDESNMFVYVCSKSGKWISYLNTETLIDSLPARLGISSLLTAMNISRAELEEYLRNHK